MNVLLLLLFEISDKVMPVASMYILLSGSGIIGGLLGLWKWWLGLIWLLVPMAFILFFVMSIQLTEIDYLYDQMINELGYGYIANSYLAPVLGVTLNVVGIYLGLVRGRRSPKLI